MTLFCSFSKCKFLQSNLAMTQPHVFAHEGVAECYTLVGQKVDASSEEKQPSVITAGH